MRRRHLGQRGTSIVEFAVLAPTFLLIALGIIEVGMQGAISAALDIGARNARRLGTTGTVGSAGPNGTIASDADRQAAIKAAVLAATGGTPNGLLDSSKLTITQQSFASVADAASGSNATSGPGSGKAYVRYTLTYAQPTYAGNWNTILTNLFGSSAAIPTVFVHTSTVLVTNEPFSS